MSKEEIQLLMETVIIGDTYEDTIGLKIYDKIVTNKIVGLGKYRKIEITDKTTNSVQYRDGKGYMSWVTVEEFFKVNKGIPIDIDGKPYKGYNPNGKKRMVKL
jgi:hypothetical protein